MGLGRLQKSHLCLEFWSVGAENETSCEQIKSPSLHHMQHWTAVSLDSCDARFPSRSSQEHHSQKTWGNDPPFVNQVRQQIRGGTHEKVKRVSGEEKKKIIWGVPVVVQQKQIWPGTMRFRVQPLASLRGLRIQYSRELWCRLQTQFGSCVPVAVYV